MNGYELPTSLTVNGHSYKIRTDFRDIINLITALTDPDLDEDAKAFVFFNILFTEPLAAEDMAEAQKAGFEFIGAGIKGDNTPSPRLMDWQQDAPLIMPAVNKTAGQDVRSLPYLHWWTFVGYYMEIGESQFSTVVSIRQKLKKHQNLDKTEKEYYHHNKSIVDLKLDISTEEIDELDQLVGWRTDNA